jgi:hypothetical protein
VARALLVLGIAVVLTAGCGTTPAPLPGARSNGERLWIDNASQLLDELDQGVVVSDDPGTDVATARAALGNQSELVNLLMANVAFGSCDESVRNVGVPTRRLERVASTLVSACRILQRASDLFTRATTGPDAHALLEASRLAERASPLLRRARLELDSVRRA